MDIGQKTEALMHARGWTLRELAERVREQGATNVKYQHLQSLMRTRGRKVAWVVELARAFGMTADQFDTWDGGEMNAVSTPENTSAHSPLAAGANREYVHIAVLTIGGAQNRGEAVKGMDIAEWWAQQNLPRPFDRVRLLTNRGDALRGDIDDGDLVFVDTRRAAWDGPGIYVLLIGGQAQPRKLHQRVGGELVIACSNPAYPPEVVPAAEIPRLPISGRVVVSLGVRRW